MEKLSWNRFCTDSTSKNKFLHGLLGVLVIYYFDQDLLLNSRFTDNGRFDGLMNGVWSLPMYIR